MTEHALRTEINPAAARATEPATSGTGRPAGAPDGASAAVTTDRPVA